MTMTPNEFKWIERTAHKFYSLALAWNFVEHCDRPLLIVMAENHQYWAVRPVDFDKLVSAGYEPAPRVG